MLSARLRHSLTITCATAAGAGAVVLFGFGPLDVATSYVTVRNECIQGGTTGIDAASAENCTIDRVAVTSADAEGIRVGHDALLTDCSARACGSHGINAANWATVVRCTARDNGIGIDLDDDSIVRDCMAAGNTSDGISTNNGDSVSGPRQQRRPSGRAPALTPGTAPARPP
jgi:hypothetical protein